MEFLVHHCLFKYALSQLFPCEKVKCMIDMGVHFDINHTCTVVQECCKGDDESLWGRGTKICIGDYIRDTYYPADFYLIGYFSFVQLLFVTVM